MTEFETVSLIIQLLSALLIAGGLLYAGKQLKLMVLTHNENHDWNRRISTQNALRDFSNTVNLDELQQQFDFLNRKHPIPINEVNELFKSKHEMQIQTHKLLNQYEAFARGVYQGIYDEEIIKNARKGSMERTFVAFSEYIQHRRNEVGKSSYIEYERLLDRWDTEDKNSSGKKQLGKA